MRRSYPRYATSNAYANRSGRDICPNRSTYDAGAYSRDASVTEKEASLYS